MVVSPQFVCKRNYASGSQQEVVQFSLDVLSGTVLATLDNAREGRFLHIACLCSVPNTVYPLNNVNNIQEVCIASVSNA